MNISSRAIITLIVFCFLVSVFGKAQNNRNLNKANVSEFEQLMKDAQHSENLLQYAKAYQCYSRCMELDSTNQDAITSLARTASTIGRTKIAEQCYQRILAADSSDFVANYQLARLYSQRGEYIKAISQYDKMMQLNKDAAKNPVVMSSLGDCYTKIENYQAAANSYFKSYSMNRENASVGSALINTMLRLGGDAIKAALPICDTALVYNPGNRLLMQNKGMALFMDKQFSASDSVYEQLLASGDSSLLTLQFCGASLFYSGHAFDAVKILNLAWQKDTTDIETTLTYGAALGMTYDRKKAFHLFDVAEENMKPKKTFIDLLTKYRGETLARDGKIDEAAALFYNAWLNDPKQSILLAQIEHLYPYNIKNIKDEETKQRSLFARHLYVTEYLKTKKSLKEFGIYRTFFEAISEEAFFNSKKNLTMMAPDGKRTTISVIALQNLAKQLPKDM